jgi:hypothetical protein
MQSQIVVTGANQVGPNAQDIRGWWNPTAFNASLGPVVLQRPMNAGDTVKVQIYNSHPSAAVNLFGGYLGMEVHRVE